jgi:hypothetical protein
MRNLLVVFFNATLVLFTRPSSNGRSSSLRPPFSLWQCFVIRSCTFVCALHLNDISSLEPSVAESSNIVGGNVDTDTFNRFIRQLQVGALIRDPEYL